MARERARRKEDEEDEELNGFISHSGKPFPKTTSGGDFGAPWALIVGLPSLQKEWWTCVSREGR